jgi:hypothetical protein
VKRSDLIEIKPIEVDGPLARTGREKWLILNLHRCARDSVPWKNNFEVANTFRRDASQPRHETHSENKMAKAKKIIRRAWTKDDVRQMKTLAKRREENIKGIETNTRGHQRNGCEARHFPINARVILTMKPLSGGFFFTRQLVQPLAI